MAEVNLQLIPDADLDALLANDLPSVSDKTLDYLMGEGSSWDAFTSNLKRGATSSLRGLGIMQPDPEEHLQPERESRMLLETNPIAGWTGLLSGSVFLDPVTIPAFAIKPFVLGGKLATGALRGSVAGSFSGAIEPVYGELGDSRTANVVGGLVVGGGVGVGVAALLRRYGIDADLTKATPEEIQAKIDELPEAQKEQLLLEWNGKIAPEPSFTVPDKPIQWNPEYPLMLT